MKFKTIPVDYFTTILDRLTRFEPAYIRYKRVYADIINKFSAGYRFDKLTILEQSNIVNDVISASINTDCTDFISPLMLNLESNYFINNDASYQYLSNSINLTSILNIISENVENYKNINWLKNISNDSDLYQQRINKSLLYPIEKILLCEGETERLLFSTLLKLFGFDLDSLGIILIPAGGKNQVARKFYSMVDYTKLPFIILMDQDAMQLNDVLSTKLRPKDKTYIIKSGEFEDLIPVDVLEKAINYIHKNEYHCLSADFNPDKSTVYNIESIYKKYGFGEFKKAHFAHSLREYIENYCTKDDFRNSEITKITQLFKN